MDYLKINFQQMRDGSLQKTFDSLERTFNKLGIDFYLIGAFARDMWMNHIDELPLRRTTRDIDFSIYISDLLDFENLKSHLESNEGFSMGEEPYRMFAPDSTIVDLLPFGGIEKKGAVYLEGESPMDISVFGNMQVLKHAVTIPSEKGQFKICTLPGLCIMKLISGSEKPDRYAKDMGDFYYILENYFEIAGDTIFETNYDDLIDEDFEPKIVSAKILGRQMGIILLESEELKRKVFEILYRLRAGFSDSEIEDMYVHQPSDIQILRMKLISQLLLEL